MARIPKWQTDTGGQAALDAALAGGDWEARYDAARAAGALPAESAYLAAISGRMVRKAQDEV